MLKKRIIALLIIKNNIIIQSIEFERFLPVGTPSISVEALNDWGIDEIILLDITARRQSQPPNISLIKQLAPYSLVPLTVGGGINEIAHVYELLQSGADKVCFNSTLREQLSLVRDASQIFGNQCIVGSVDIIQINKRYYLYDYLSKKPLDISLKDYIQNIQESGVGEILLNSVNKDGAKTGYDIELVNYISPMVDVPLIICGGVGSAHHIVKAINCTKADAFAASNFFHFTEHSATVTKSLVCDTGVIRHETYAKYESNPTDHLGRLKKKPESDLNHLLYQKLIKEVI